MVEVRIIPEGVSGIKKVKKQSTKRAPRPTRRQWREMTPEEKIEARKRQAERQPKGYFGNANDYFAHAAKTARRMQRENEEENKRVRPSQIRKLVRDNLIAAYPHLPLAEIEKMVDKNLDGVLKAYMGPVYEHNTSDEVRAVWNARVAERKRVVRSMRNRRKENYRPSKADLEWMATGRR
jgi:uncharacterized protein YeeX (DUF496 family)